MLCHEFEKQLTDYLDGTLSAETNRLFAEHAIRCPICHDLLSEVKNTLLVCSSSEAPPAGAGLEARILLRTAPETAITCADFEEHLTDYLDGFLLAPLYHRWERHAALCAECSALPGEVVRSIGACYSYLQEELPVPAGLEARILQSTIGSVVSRDVRAPAISRLLEWLRGSGLTGCKEGCAAGFSSNNAAGVGVRSDEHRFYRRVGERYLSRQPATG